MSLRIVSGDLLEAIDPYNLDAIAHGVNCVGAMGAGIALQIARKWPAMEQEYKELCNQQLLKPGQCWPWNGSTLGTTKRPLTIYNVASQDMPGASARYGWLGAGIEQMLEHAETHSNNRIGIPRMGTGIGGLKVSIAEQIFQSLFGHTRCDVYLFDLPTKEKK